MGRKTNQCVSMEAIKNEFGLKRRRTAEVLVNNAIKKFKSHLAILSIMDSVSPGHEKSDQSDSDLDRIADIYVGLLKSNKLKDLSIDYLRGTSYGA